MTADEEIISEPELWCTCDHNQDGDNKGIHTLDCFYMEKVLAKKLGVASSKEKK